MKKLMLILVMGMCGTVVLAQDTKTEISTEKTEATSDVRVKLKDKLAATESAAPAELQATKGSKKLDVNGTMVATKAVRPEELEEK